MSSSPVEEVLQLSGESIPLILAKNPRARRYVLRVRPDRTARVAIPRGGSVSGARQFAQRHLDWIEKALIRLARRPTPPKEWKLGSVLLLRGQELPLERWDSHCTDAIRWGEERIAISNIEGDLRKEVEMHLSRLAARELPARVLELAALHQLKVNRVTIRNQRSRWGSCSRRATLSLNWRILQAPASVRDYLILHELMHLRQMNHSARFWHEVEKVCPDFREAEAWLNRHSYLLR